MATLLTPFTRLNHYLKRHTNMYMVLVAVVIGLIGGYGAVGFRLLIQWFKGVFWAFGSTPTDHSPLLEHITTLPWYWVVGAPTLGGLFVGWLVGTFAAEAKGHGVPEVMEAVALRNGRIRPRVVGIKALASSVCIATGGSVGREGPIVQIGSAIGSTLGQFLNVGPRRMRTFVGCGAAAGVAATFNAPVAGALFALEIILGDFGVSQFTTIVVASVTATVVSRSFFGDIPAFEIPTYSLEHPTELIAYVALGLLAGLTAIAFVRTLHFCEDGFDAANIPASIKAGIGGLLVGGLALVAPQVLGLGYEAMTAALTGPGMAMMMLGLLFAKLVAVSITLGSGGSGGVFAPSLFMGATLGAALGAGVGHFFPGAAPPGAYALVGMGAMVASTTHAPLTAIVILFELTTDYKIILPLMIAAITGTLVMRRLHPDSIYTIKLKRRGVDLSGGRDLNLLRRVTVEQIMATDAVRVAPNECLGAIVKRVLSGNETCLYVVNDAGQFMGTLSVQALRPMLEDLDVLQNMLTAEDVLATDWPTAKPTDQLDHVLEVLDRGFRDEIPVVGADGLFQGSIRMADVLARYKKELFSYRMAGELADSMPVGDDSAGQHKVGNFVMAEVEVPPALLGRSLAEVGVREAYGVNILLCRPADGSEPSPPISSYVFVDGDKLVVFGAAEDVNRLRG